MVIIIGAGLSGLLTAYRLKEKGIPFKILEARDRIGGRIHTLESKNGTPLEMGATWFTQEHSCLLKLLKELNLPYFEQYMKGTAFFQQYPDSPASLIDLPPQAPSYRIAGGTTMLLETLYKAMDKEDVLFNQTVKKIQVKDNSILIEATENHEAELVVLAIPPKLWAQHISFVPNLPTPLKDIATKTHTWMEDSMKVAFVYETAFWREKKQSGTFFSNTGPITEFYDHSNLEGNKHALCGFVNPYIKDLAIEERKTLLIEQLRENFGEEATQFTEYQECIWSNEKNTFTSSPSLLHPHQNNGNPIFTNTLFEDRLLFSSTEVSPHHGGYMEGAVIIAEEIANKVQQQLS